MDAVIEHLDTQYEIVFSEPLFDLPKRDAEVLRNFHRSLRQSEYSVPLSEVRVINGEALSDTKIQISMFRDLATIDLMTDRMSVEFKQLKSLEHLDIYESCIGISERAIRTTYPELIASMTSLFCNAQIKIKENRDNVQQLLKNVVGYGNDIDLSEFGDTQRVPAANITILNDQERWNSVFHAFVAFPDPLRLIASCRLSYTEVGASQNSDDRLHEFKGRAKTLQRLFATLVGGIGINLTPFDWEEDKGENHGV